MFIAVRLNNLAQVAACRASILSKLVKFDRKLCIIVSSRAYFVFKCALLGLAQSLYYFCFLV